MSRVAIIGGGAAGMAAGLFFAKEGHDVTIFEQNEKLGKKLFITGKGRCNFTNLCEREELLRNVVTNPKFLYSAFRAFDAARSVALFEELGVPTKVERGNRAFPASDHSSDIIGGLLRGLRGAGVRIRLHTKVTDIALDEAGKAAGVTLATGERLPFDKVVLASGGCSYASTGSDGSGYEMARALGIPVKECFPALVPLVAKEDYIPMLQGLSLRNVTLDIHLGKKTLFSEFGELLFTHFGISGPLALSASSVIAKTLQKGPLAASIDLKPALSAEQLDARILREFEAAPNKAFKNAISSLFPSKLLPVMLALSQVAPERKVHDITKRERAEFAALIKAFPLSITKSRGFAEAIITQGGIDVRRVNPSTMESKDIKNLYIIGEVLDLDALTGGFNLQIAWSTAYLAASSATN